MINYKRDVKNKYPTADVINMGHGYIVFNGGIAIPQAHISYSSLTPSDAWKSAYDNLKQQGKI
jgi:hypothetical protein